MRTRRLAPALLCVLGLFPFAARAEEGVKAVDVEWLKAMKANNVDALVACYAPDAVMWLPNAAEARGAKAIRDMYAGLLSQHTVKDASLSSAISQTSGDLSTGWGNFTLTLQPKSGGAVVVEKGRFTAVAKKIGGKWLYVADHASDDPPPAPPK